MYKRQIVETVQLILKPRWENETVADVEIFAELPADTLPENGAELLYCKEGWLCVPFAEFEGLKIEDCLLYTSRCV